MIGETNALNSTIQTERLFRQNSGEAAARPNEQEDVSQQNGGTDSVSFSQEAIALARNVAPTGESSEIIETGQSTNSSPGEQNQQNGGRIDLMA